MDSKSASIVVIAVLAAAVLVSGYGNTGLHAAETAGVKPHGGLLEKHERGDARALRVRNDADGHRLWVLTLEDVYVYDTRKLELIRRVRLPNWSVAAAGFMCAPDLVLDGRGTAFVSNNVQPRLVQIGPPDFQPKEHELRLISHKQWDIGFGALSFGANGTLFGVSALAGSLFRIDLKSSSATEIGRATTESCEAL